METEKAKDNEYEEKLVKLLLDKGDFSQAVMNEVGILLRKILLDNASLREDLNSCKKRLQRLEIARKQGKASNKSADNRSRSNSVPPAKKNASSDKKGGKKSALKTSSVKFQSASDNSSVGGKSVNSNLKSNKSNKSNPKNGSTTRIKVWKLLPPNDKKRLRKEEDEAYKKLPKDKWQLLTAIERTVVGKERKIRIQKFQERVTAIALQMAEQKAKEKQSRKAEEKKEMAVEKLGEPGQVGTSKDKLPNINLGRPLSASGGGGSRDDQSSPGRRQFLVNSQSGVTLPKRQGY